MVYQAPPPSSRFLPTIPVSIHNNVLFLIFIVWYMEISPIIRIFSSFTPLLTLEYLGLGKKFQRHISQIKYYPQPGFWASKKGSGWGGVLRMPQFSLEIFLEGRGVTHPLIEIVCVLPPLKSGGFFFNRISLVIVYHLGIPSHRFVAPNIWYPPVT